MPSLVPDGPDDASAQGTGPAHVPPDGYGDWTADAEEGGPHEAGRLALEVARARAELGVAARWSLGEAIERTMRWYRNQRDGASALALCEADIADHEATPDPAAVLATSPGSGRSE